MVIVCSIWASCRESIEQKADTQAAWLWFSLVSLSMGVTVLLIASKPWKGSDIPYCLGLGGRGSLGDPVVCQVG